MKLIVLSFTGDRDVQEERNLSFQSKIDFENEY